MNQKGNIAGPVAIAVAEVIGIYYKKPNSGLQSIIVNQLCEGFKMCGIRPCSLGSGVDTKKIKKDSEEVQAIFGNVFTGNFS